MSLETRNKLFLSDLVNRYPDQTNRLHPDVSALKARAVKELTGRELPTTRHEEWKYLSLKPLANEEFLPAQDMPVSEVPVTAQEYIYPEAEHHHLTFINGKFSQELSKTDRLPEGVIVDNLSAILSGDYPEARKELGSHAVWEDDPFVSLNTAVFEDGAFIYVPSSVRVEEPIQLLFLNTDASRPYFMAPRCLIIGGKSSEMTVVEDHVGLADNVYFSVPVSEIKLAENSHMTHVKLQRESRNAWHISRLAADISRDSNYKSYAIQLGAHVSRSDVMAKLTDENTHATLDGLVMVNGDQLSDTHSIMDHTMPNCTSHQLHKC
ncbi:SufD family Fe-S cluster assembly protein, partial [Balneolaceae bacterium ANBcel3]|nr:SufD family Fe-S cluster assembly protein [Balneolaceae bacterium ANBcel3]